MIPKARNDHNYLIVQVNKLIIVPDKIIINMLLTRITPYLRDRYINSGSGKGTVP